jgi:HK97 family phage prohead protease
MMQTLVSFGDAIKADDSGRVRGYLVRFGGADLEGDYFTASTDFGRPMKSGERVPMNLYYHHGQDKQVGKSRIGTGYITMDDKGLWYESQVDMADSYQKMIQELAKSGKLGYSSGATGHMVERKKMSDGRYEITRWPIGEASLTPTPAEPMNMVKSLKDMYGDMEDGMEEEMMIPVAPGEDVATFVENVYGDLAAEMVHEGIEALYNRLCAGMMAALDAGLGRGHIDAIIDAFASKAKELTANLKDPAAEVQSMKSKHERPTSIREVERRLRDAVCLSRAESTRFAKTIWSELRDEVTTEDVTIVEYSSDIEDAKSALLRELMILELSQ